MAKYDHKVVGIKDQKPTVAPTEPTISTDPKNDSQYGSGPQGAVAGPPGGGGGGAYTCSCNCSCNCAGSACACSGSTTMKKVSALRKKL